MTPSSILARFNPWNRNWLLGKLFELRGGIYICDGLTFKIPHRAMPTSLKARFLLDSYERPERQLVRENVVADDCVLELGACLGVVSCAINTQLKRQGNQVSLEANPELQDIVAENRTRNRCGFIYLSGMIGDGSAVDFWVSSVPTASSELSKRGIRISVRSFTIESLCVLVDQPFTCLVLDIEGAELELVPKLLAELQSLRTVIIETHRNIYGRSGLDSIECAFTQKSFICKKTIGNVTAWVR